jgi:hypothetical protein
MNSWTKTPVFCFTSDIDWASEPIIKRSHECLGATDLKLTYFNTHPSPFLEELHRSGIARMLIHPNFLPDSSQGNTFDEVIEYCCALVPDADGFRSHRYFEVNDVIDALADRGFRFVSNQCTQCETGLRPLRLRSGLISLPIFLEDGGHLYKESSLDLQTLIPKLESPGLKIVNFHPTYMALNAPDWLFTRQIQNTLSREEWNNIDEEQIDKLEYHGQGIRSLIKNIITFVRERGFPLMSMHEIVDEYESTQL